MCSIVPELQSQPDIQYFWSPAMHSQEYTQTSRQLQLRNRFQYGGHTWAPVLSCIEWHWYEGQLGGRVMRTEARTKKGKILVHNCK